MLSNAHSISAERRSRSIFVAALFGALCSAAAAAGADPADAATGGQRVWPAPPGEARIAYVKSIASPSDLGIRAPFLRRMSNWIAGARQGNEPLNRPFGLALDTAGNLCVTDTGANVVCYFDRAAKRWHRWEEIGGIRFGSPVAVAKEGDLLFVADSAASVIVAFTVDGKPRFRISEGLQRPSGLAVSGGRLLVADAGEHVVAIFDLGGKPAGRLGSRGAGPGQFNFPTHVAADARGNIYVTDSMNGRVQVFGPKGDYLRTIGAYGGGPGSFSRPKGVAADASGRTYVVDGMFDNFQIFDPESRLLLDVGRAGSGTGEFWLPNGIAVGGDYMIYVADSYNSRIQVFKYVGRK